MTLNKIIPLVVLICLIHSCIKYPVVSLKLNDIKVYKLNTDCGILTITSDVLLFSEGTKILGIQLESDKLKEFSIKRKNLRLFSGTKEIPQDKQHLDGTKTKMSVNFTLTDTTKDPLLLYLTADNFILCNGRSLINDTLTIKLVNND